MAIKPDRVVTYFKAFLESLGLARSRDKRKPLYLHYHSDYNHQTWQVDDLHWGAPSYKVT